MPSIRRRKRAKRDVYVVDYRDGAGVRRLETYATKQEAEDALARVIPESRQAIAPAVNRDITIEDYSKRWLLQIASEIKPRTLRSYKQQVKLHVLPAFGHFRVRALHRGHIKAVLAEKRAGGLSKNSVRMIRATLSVMLSDAVEDGVILANAALQLRGTRRRRADTLTQADRQKAIRPMSQAQLSAFLAAAESDSRHYALFLLLARTGMRPGEAYGLQWGDLDLRARELRVERSWSLGRVETPKTGETRTVDMSEQLVRGLRRHEIDRMVEKVKRGWAEMPPWVFCTDEGTPLDESRVRKAYSQALRRAKLPAFRLYDLRHTYASLLLAQGAPITYVSSQLGHTDATTTLRWYARWIPRTDKRAVDALDDVRPAPKLRLEATQGWTVGDQSGSGKPNRALR
jgi:integrase